MFFSQMSCVAQGTSTIDKLKGIEKATSKTGWQLVKEVFGGDFSISWFFPTRIQLELTIEEQY